MSHQHTLIVWSHFVSRFSYAAGCMTCCISKRCMRSCLWMQFAFLSAGRRFKLGKLHDDSNLPWNPPQAANDQVSSSAETKELQRVKTPWGDRCAGMKNTTNHDSIRSVWMQSDHVFVFWIVYLQLDCVFGLEILLIKCFSYDRHYECLIHSYQAGSESSLAFTLEEFSQVWGPNGRNR